MLVPASIQHWAEEHGNAVQQMKRLNLTKEWIDALFEVHAHQIFNLGCFNADAHPGNILVVDEDSERPKLGLIDFGQCKRLTQHEQSQIGQLLVHVANNESDEAIAGAFRDLGIQTKNNSSEFLAKFAKLMFGPLQSYHLDHSWHRALHEQDTVTHFPSQLSMVYRTSMLLRGLAVSLQFNVSVGDLWKAQAQEAIDRHEAASLRISTDADSRASANVPKTQVRPLIRRMSSEKVVEDLQELGLRR
jgi:aarF domain-containing kinase